MHLHIFRYIDTKLFTVKFWLRIQIRIFLYILNKKKYFPFFEIVENLGHILLLLISKKT